MEDRQGGAGTVDRGDVGDDLGEEVDGTTLDRTYNQVVSTYLRSQLEDRLEDPDEAEELAAHFWKALAASA